MSKSSFGRRRRKRRSASLLAHATAWQGPGRRRPQRRKTRDRDDGEDLELGFEPIGEVAERVRKRVDPGA